MKKFLGILSLAIITVFSSCEGDQGPPGPPGLDGADGLLGFTIDITNVDFNAPDFFTRVIFEDFGITPEPSDAVLVYRLEDVVDGLNVWEPLPTATIFLDDPDQTTVLYRFNFTSGDVDIILESSNFNAVPSDLTQDQVFRIILVPSDFALDNDVDISNIESVLSKLNIKDEDISSIKMN